MPLRRRRGPHIGLPSSRCERFSINNVCCPVYVCRKAVLLGHAPAGGGDGDGIGDGDTYASAASSRERRRLSIKAAKVRRRKQEIEISTMAAEDERSKLENQAHRVRVPARWLDRRCSRYIDVVVMTTAPRAHDA